MTEKQTIKKLKELLKEPLKWWDANRADDGLLYDDSCAHISELDRGALYEILKVLDGYKLDG